MSLLFCRAMGKTFSQWTLIFYLLLPQPMPVLLTNSVFPLGTLNSTPTLATTVFLHSVGAAFQYTSSNILKAFLLTLLGCIPIHLHPPISHQFPWRLI